MQSIVLDFETTDASEDASILCKVCSKHKNKADFYLSTIRRNQTGKCKCCHKKMAALYRENNKDKIRVLSAQPHSVEARRVYQLGVGRAACNEASKRHREKHPKREKAKSAIGHAIRDKKIVRPNLCEGCNSYCVPQGHHCDYNKPLDVMWLCIDCHTEWHKNHTPIY